VDVREGTPEVAAVPDEGTGDPDDHRSDTNLARG
jgi:hypothetical protein